MSILATASSSSAVRGMRLLDELAPAEVVAAGAAADDLPFGGFAADDLPFDEVDVAAGAGPVHNRFEVPLVDGSSSGVMEAAGPLRLTSTGGGDSEEERSESPFILIASRSISMSVG